MCKINWYWWSCWKWVWYALDICNDYWIV